MYSLGISDKNCSIFDVDNGRLILVRALYIHSANLCCSLALVTKYVEQSVSVEANSHCANQEILLLLCLLPCSQDPATGPYP
jgi:hypothetical protein